MNLTISNADLITRAQDEWLTDGVLAADTVINLSERNIAITSYLLEAKDEQAHG